MSGATTGGIAAAIAAAKKRREEKEEEAMTKYKDDELEGWEFKIVRSSWGRFGNPEFIRRVREEEAEAGWEMIEKFDNSRIRFKRRIDKRSKDQFLKIDPYRSFADGLNVNFFVMGLILLLFGGTVLAVLLTR